MEDQNQTWKEQYPELWAEISAATTRQELNKIWRSIMKRYDADLIPSKATGAIFAFKAEMQERTAIDTGASRSYQEARIDRILHTGATDSRGRAIARKF